MLRSHRSLARFVLAFAAIILLVGIGFACWLFRPARDTLLDRATALGSTKEWKLQDPRFQFYSPFRWLSDHEILYPRQRAAGVFQAVRRDLTTGREQLLATPTMQMSLRRLLLPQPAPDGKTLLWLDTKANQSRALVTDLDGKVLRVWPWEHASYCYWLSDSHTFATTAWVNRRSHLYLHHLDRPQIDVKTLDPCQAFWQGVTSIAPNGSVAGLARVLLPPGQFALNYHLVEYDPKGTLQLETPITMPIEDRFALPFPSPDGSKLVWHVTRTQILPLYAWINRHFPQFKVSPEQIEELWISDANGAHPRQLVRHPLNRQRNNTIRTLDWLPDGKKLSFLYGSKLYVLPTN